MKLRNYLHWSSMAGLPHTSGAAALRSWFRTKKMVMGVLALVTAAVFLARGVKWNIRLGCMVIIADIYPRNAWMDVEIEFGRWRVSAQKYPGPEIGGLYLDTPQWSWHRGWSYLLDPSPEDWTKAPVRPAHCALLMGMRTLVDIAKQKRP